jgi:hypothetical protein
MEIVQRNNKYFLQLANGELELSEQQVKKRVERGDKLREYLQKLESKEQPKIPIKEEPKPGAKPSAKTAQTFITSGKYFDNLIREFEEIYRTSEEKEEAAEKLIRFCNNAILKLQHDRKNPKTDHVVIDYYVLSWSRVISFIQSLTNTEPAEPPAAVVQEAVIEKPKDLTKQLVIIQLMQAEGIFPISNALEGINQTDILNLIGGVIDAKAEDIELAFGQASAILLKRDITKENFEERVTLIEELEAYFEQLPYSNIISRIKVLHKAYKNTKL